MNSAQRLFVTPEELSRRKADESRHPHGGEGKCGGNEGHGTPELQRKKAEQGSVGGGKPRAEAPKPPERKAPVKHAGKAENAVGVSREQLASAMRLSFALGEPACRRYGLPSFYGRKSF